MAVRRSAICARLTFSDGNVARVKPQRFHLGRSSNNLRTLWLTRIEILHEPKELLLLLVPLQCLRVDGSFLDQPSSELGVLIPSTETGEGYESVWIGGSSQGIDSLCFRDDSVCSPLRGHGCGLVLLRFLQPRSAISRDQRYQSPLHFYTPSSPFSPCASFPS
jgi:hypothetical protein